MKPKVGLVTVLYCSEQVLPGFVESISRQQGQPYHLYLVDNSPGPKTDRLLTDLMHEHPHIPYSYIPNENNYGVAKGNNQGIQAALKDGCASIILLNNDIEIESDTLLRDMVSHAEQHKEPLIIPKILFYDTRKICMAGGKLDEQKATTAHIGALQEDGPEFNIPAYFNFAPTTFMFINGALFEELGLMDEQYFVYYDDTDFVYRAGKKGYRIYYMPSLSILHKESSLTGGIQSDFSIFYMNRNRLYFIKKNFNGFQKIRGLLYLFLDFLRLMKYYQPAQRKVLMKAMKAGINM